MFTPPGYKFVTAYIFHHADGSYFFEKHRFANDGSDPTKRPKEFRYFTADTHLSRKPAGADEILYRLPGMLAGVASGQCIHWAEGEKDADALFDAGVIATSAHQGAGRVTAAQAAWLRGATEVVLWVDKDRGHWEVGAYDAVLRHNLLIDAGVPSAAIRFVRALGQGKDAFDHLQRYDIAKAVSVDKETLAKVASGYKFASRTFVGYRRG